MSEFIETGVLGVDEVSDINARSGSIRSNAERSKIPKDNYIPEEYIETYLHPVVANLVAQPHMGVFFRFSSLPEANSAQKTLKRRLDVYLNTVNSGITEEQFQLRKQLIGILHSNDIDLEIGTQLNEDNNTVNIFIRRPKE